MSLPRSVYNPSEPQQSMSLANLRNTLRALHQGDLMPLRARASMALDFIEYATNALAQANWSGTGITITTTTTKQEGNYALQAVIDATGNRTLQNNKNFNLSAFKRVKFWERCSVGAATFRFFLRDNSGNESYWNCTSDSANVWKQFDLDLSTPDANNGTNANLANIVRFGFNQLGASRTFIFDHIIAICGLNVAIEGALIAGFYRGVYLGSTNMTFSGGSSPAITPPSANPRIDLLVLKNDNTLEWILGAEASIPSEPTIPVGKIPICYVYCRVGMTQIVDFEDKDTNPTEGYIYRDLRPLITTATATFLGLTDTPSSYAGQALKFTRVNSDANALEFVDLATLAVLLTGDQDVDGVKRFLKIPLLPATDPTTDNQASRKKYTDDKIAERFHTTTGHDHDGTDSKKLDATGMSAVWGDWETRANNTIYQAGTDGFVTAWNSGANAVDIYIYSDASNPPTTVRLRGAYNSGIGETGVIACPVKKNHYWRIVATHSPTIWFISLGT